MVNGDVHDTPPSYAGDRQAETGDYTVRYNPQAGHVALYRRRLIRAEDAIDGQPGEPFNILFDSDVQRIAIERQHQTTESGRRTGNVVGLNNDHLVETRGLEPLTPALQRQCSAS